MTEMPSLTYPPITRHRLAEGIGAVVEPLDRDTDRGNYQED